jgi:uncharacterized membrane protein (DUF106 family)
MTDILLVLLVLLGAFSGWIADALVTWQDTRRWKRQMDEQRRLREEACREFFRRR